MSGRMQSEGGWGSTMLVVSLIFTAPGNVHGLFSLACVLMAFGRLASTADAWSRLCSWLRSGGEEDFFSSFLPCTWALYCTQTHKKGQEASHPGSHNEISAAAIRCIHTYKLDRIHHSHLLGLRGAASGFLTSSHRALKMLSFVLGGGGGGASLEQIVLLGSVWRVDARLDLSCETL